MNIREAINAVNRFVESAYDDGQSVSPDMLEADKLLVNSQWLIEDMATYVKNVCESEMDSYGLHPNDAYLYERLHELMGWDIPEEYKKKLKEGFGESDD